jgi:hypothetical protein
MIGMNQLGVRKRVGKPSAVKDKRALQGIKAGEIDVAPKRWDL